jgi:RND superfamily putative drug exporter
VADDWVSRTRRAASQAVYGAFPLLLTVVSVATLVILVWSLRSIVLPIKAVLLNIVSLGSAFGFMVFFRQEGRGSALIYGVPATDAIRAWIPTEVFASLLARTGRLVTCAALILMVTLLSLSIDPNQLVEISSTTLAVGVIMDAVIIRTLLVPALVALMGRWNWWMPGGLARYLPARTSGH